MEGWVYGFMLAVSFINIYMAGYYLDRGKYGPMLVSALSVIFFLAVALTWR